MTGYTLRRSVESFFSGFKRMYGDRVLPKLFKMMVMAMRIGYILYTIRRTSILRRIDGTGGYGYTFS